MKTLHGLSERCWGEGELCYRRALFFLAPFFLVFFFLVLSLVTLNFFHHYGFLAQVCTLSQVMQQHISNSKDTVVRYTEGLGSSGTGLSLVGAQSLVHADPFDLCYWFTDCNFQCFQTGKLKSNSKIRIEENEPAPPIRCRSSIKSIRSSQSIPNNERINTEDEPEEESLIKRNSERFADNRNGDDLNVKTVKKDRLDDWFGGGQYRFVSNFGLGALISDCE